MRLSIYGSIFQLYLSPKLQATVTAQPSSSACNGGIVVESEWTEGNPVDLARRPFCASPDVLLLLLRAINIC